ncbi:alpha/beta fold hydrolase [Streptomyces daliensis]|uniref:Alpha/beta fold hydrolase n=1 Tax=Streptomyces daliensis TaxID=299421 RepID=A0A8T4J3V7_9ACTN|nr:alpha/beta fold hydrolase [Streptomyces daliensis]
MDTESLTSFDGAAISYHTWRSDRPADAALPPVVLQHGFAASTESNWVHTGVVAALNAAGRDVIGVDARGHGRSQKGSDPSFFGERNMSRDHLALFDHLGLDQVDLVGYSMGAIISLLTASHDPRVRRLVVGGVGAAVVELGGVDTRATGGEGLAAALSTTDPSTLTGPGAAFRQFAEATGADLPSLAAQAAAVHSGHIDVGAITAPTLLIAGDDDPLAVRPGTLSAAIPDAKLLGLPGDHLSVVGHPEFAPAVVDFLTRLS